MNIVPIGWGIVGDSATALADPRAQRAADRADSRSKALRIAYWLGARRTVPTVTQIVDTWHVSRATAFRWRRFAQSGGHEYPSSHKQETEA